MSLPTNAHEWLRCHKTHVTHIKYNSKGGAPRDVVILTALDVALDVYRDERKAEIDAITDENLSAATERLKKAKVAYDEHQSMDAVEFKEPTFKEKEEELFRFLGERSNAIIRPEDVREKLGDDYEYRVGEFLEADIQKRREEFYSAQHNTGKHAESEYIEARDALNQLLYTLRG